MDDVEPEGPRWAELMRRRARQQAIDAAVELPSWPVYAPHLPDQPCWVGGFGRRNGRLVTIGFSTGDQCKERELVVTNELLPGGTITSLDRVLADRFTAAGRDYPVPGELPASTFQALPEAPRARATIIVIDGVATSGLVQHEAEFSAVRVVKDDVVITATGRGLDPGSIEFVRVSDLAPYRARPPVARPTASRTLNWRSDSGWHRPPDRSRPLWAHRGLLEMTMLAFVQHRNAMTLNRPHQRLQPDWGLWWAAATAQQQELTGQDEMAAKQTISDMVNQIAFLGGQANWWSRQELRQRAVNQILWFTATGDQAISSAPAQRAWTQRARAGRHQHDALEAWATWAADQR